MITKFYNRVEELNFLESDKKNSLTIIYGRRRVGKTELIKQFSKNKNSIYFFVEVIEDKKLLDLWCDQLTNSLGYKPAFSWDEFFKFVFKNFDIVVFDEFQNFNKINSSILYKIQKVWDGSQNTKLFILGSYVNMMKNIFQDQKNPLFGRAKNILKIKPFSFRASFSMLKDFGYSFKESIIIYSLVDGVPKYLWLFEDKKNIFNQIKDLFISDFGSLREEAKNILISEFGSLHKGYFSILNALVKPRTKAEVVDKTRMDPGSVGKYLTDLYEDLELVSTSFPVVTTKKRGVKYYLSNNNLIFWFKYIYLMESFTKESVLTKIKSELNVFVSKIFENVCKELLPNLLSKQQFSKIGCQWGKFKGETGKNTYEIDIVALNEDKNEILFGECKWQDSVDAGKILVYLKEKSKFVQWNNSQRKESFAIFAKSFKDKNLKGVKLFDLDDLEKIVRK